MGGPPGAIFYHGMRRRHEVKLDYELRRCSESAVAATRAILEEVKPPPAPNDARSPKCSLINACMPRVVGEPARMRGIKGALSFIPGRFPQTAMIELLNVMYVLTQGARLHLDHDTVLSKSSARPGCARRWHGSAESSFSNRPP